MRSVTDLREASAQFFANVVAGQDVEDGVDSTVYGGQAERDGVRCVHGRLEQTGAVLELGEVEDDCSDQQDDVVRGEADQEQHHHCHRKPADVLLLFLAQPCAALHVGHDATVRHHQYQQRYQKANHEAGIVEPRHHGAALAWFEAAAVTFIDSTLPHGEDGDVTEGDKQYDGKGDEESEALPTEGTGLHTVDDGNVAVAGDAAEQEDADVHVVEENIAC